MCFSHCLPEQQALASSFPSFAQQAISCPSPGLPVPQQEAEALSPFEQDFASFPLQHEAASFASLPAQQDISLPSFALASLCFEQAMSLWSADAIFSQQGQLAFAGLEFCPVGAGVVD